MAKKEKKPMAKTIKPKKKVIAKKKVVAKVDHIVDPNEKVEVVIKIEPAKKPSDSWRGRRGRKARRI